MMSQQQIIGYFDGACEPVNPGGIASYGVVVYKNSRIIWISSETVFVKKASETSNQLAEYAGAIRLLKFLIDNGLTDIPVEIRGDSKLVINQLFGAWSINSGYYVSWAFQAKELLNKFSTITGKWIPREQNTFADKLSVEAIKFYESQVNKVLT